jgi:chromosome segregation ATPase
MLPDLLRHHRLIIAGVGVVASLALSAAAGFGLATYQFTQLVGPEYRSWPALLEVERTLLPVAETMLRTREVLKRREAELNQTLGTREQELNDRYSQREAAMKLEGERLDAWRKSLEQKERELSPGGRDIAQLQRSINEEKERANALELALEEERATVKRLRRPATGTQDTGKQQAVLDEAIAKLDKSLEATGERRIPIRPKP